MNQQPPSEVPFHSLPETERYDVIERRGCDLPNGSQVIVGRRDGTDDFHVELRAPQPEGDQSVLKFLLTRQAAIALAGLILTHIEEGQP